MGAIGSVGEGFHTGPGADPEARQEQITLRVVMTEWSGFGHRGQYEMRLAVSEDLRRDAVNAEGWVEGKLDKFLAEVKKRYMNQAFPGRRGR